MLNFLSHTNLWSISFLILLIISVLSLNEFLNKKNNEEIKRKIPHIIIGSILAIIPIYMTKTEILISALIIFLGIWISRYFKLFKSIFSVKRISLGIWIIPFSLSIMTFLWLPNNKLPFVFGMLILTFSDAIAAIIGKKFGKKKIPFTEKTYIGSFGFFITTFIIFSLLAPHFIFWKIFLGSLFLSFLELILIFGLDNFFLPIFASTIFYLFF